MKISKKSCGYVAGSRRPSHGVLISWPPRPSDFSALHSATIQVSVASRAISWHRCLPRPLS